MNKSVRPRGLGRGLDVLLPLSHPPSQPEPPPSTPPKASPLFVCGIEKITPCRTQPRQHFDAAALDELTASIRLHGVLEPLVVRKLSGEERFEIIAGERRWRAAQRAGLHEVPVYVREVSEQSAFELALVENVQRQDLNAIEEAEGYSSLIEKYGHAQDAVGKLVGKSRSHVTNLLRLLKLPDSVREMLLRGDITMGHARALLGAPDPEMAARLVVAKGLSVRQTEALAKVGTGKSPSRAAEHPRRSVDADLAALERQLGDMLGLNVKVKHAGKGGTVSLAYSSLDQLDMICQRLSGEAI